MYESYNKPLLPRPVFLRRLARHAAAAFATLLVCLGLGMAGYHHFEHLPWIDSFANASMILSGMGPLGDLKTTGGKLFAGCYALFSGVVFLTLIAVFLAPIIHRFLHVFHLPEEAAPPAPKSKSKS
jgi:hypothetical protein